MTVILVLLGFAAVAVADETRVLGDAAWRADITQAADTIRQVHPRPFRMVTAQEFDTATRRLIEDVPGLTDKEVIVRLAALVAMVADGHTRLTIPREHPDLGLEFGHTPTPQPQVDALRFRQLPIQFREFADGVHVVAADDSHAELIGHRLDAIGGTPIAEAMRAVQAICFAGNSQLASLMGADRLSLPEALSALGIVRSADVVELVLTAPEGETKTVSLSPLPRVPPAWVDPFADGALPLRLRHPGQPFWSEYISDGNFVYLQLNEIVDAEVPLAEFITNTLSRAVENDARLVIDLRSNFGGSGGLNRTLVTSIIGDAGLNQRGRTFVLIGRRTFSAAQMLVNELERYTRVIFVGEPTGSRPDHFGDPEKVRLDNSGLTLRVSRLHWSSYTAFDDREATRPDFEAPWFAKDYFAGADPALSTALSLEDVSLKTLLRAALARGDLQQVARHTLDCKLSPDTYDDDFSDILRVLGDEFLAAGQPGNASLAYRVGLYFYPDHEAFKTALEGLPSTPD